MELLDELKGNSFVWLLLGIITIASLIIAIHEGRKRREKKQISYAKRSSQLISVGNSVIDKLSLKYDGKPIEDLYVTRIAIWNSCSILIKPEDFVSSEFLRILASNEAQLLDARVVYSSDKASRVAVSSFSSSEVCIGFDFLEKDRGVILQLLHSGGDGSLNVSGRIMGGKPLKEHIASKGLPLPGNRSTFQALSLVSIGGMLATLLFSLIRSFLQFIEVVPTSVPVTVSSEDWGLMVVYFVVMAICWLVMLALFVLLLRMRFKPGIPTELKKRL